MKNNFRMIALFALYWLLPACNDGSEDKDFEELTDCVVYQDEIKTETFYFGKVKSIDSTKASDCSKQVLGKVYLLYEDKVPVAVYNEHPQKEITLIHGLARNATSDSTRLSRFVRFDTSIVITVDRICRDSIDTPYFHQYLPWRQIEYSTRSLPFTVVKVDTLNSPHDWFKR